MFSNIVNYILAKKNVTFLFWHAHDQLLSQTCLECVISIYTLKHDKIQYQIYSNKFAH